ncbi:MAG: dTDP-4-dehydrorhamnose reductase [Zoogloeaceae bacterium]|nr:dTDP-4-dehydrorhamnose reductase [Zoogloeaceae bacterium]
MKLLVTGAAGQVGWELRRSLLPLGEVVALDRNACDLGRPESLASVVEAVAPDVVVNAAAYTAVDRAETEEALATRINGLAVGELGRAARRFGALMIHYSTDYVFAGHGQIPWTEGSAVGPLNAYGRSKLAGELALAESGADALTLRTSWVYAARGRNFFLTMLRLAQEREELRVVADQFGAPTWARNIADATALIVVQAMAERRKGVFRSEVLHLASGGVTTWHGFAAALIDGARRLRPDLTFMAQRIVPISTADYPVPAARPANSRLTGSALRSRYGLALPAWEVAMARCIEEWAAL